MARGKKGMTPDELEKRVGAYFDECAASDEFPDRASMILYLGLPTDTYLRFESNEDGEYAAFAEVLEKARFMREGWLSRVMFRDKNRAQSAVFQLRQQANGGYSEKQAPGAVSIRLKLGDGENDLVE